MTKPQSSSSNFCILEYHASSSPSISSSPTSASPTASPTTSPTASPTASPTTSASPTVFQSCPTTCPSGFESCYGYDVRCGTTNSYGGRPYNDCADRCCSSSPPRESGSSIYGSNFYCAKPTRPSDCYCFDRTSLSLGSSVETLTSSENRPCEGSECQCIAPVAPSTSPSYLPSPQPTQCIDEKDWKVGEDGGIYSSMTCLHINDASEPQKYCNAIDKISDAKFEGKTVREACWYVMFYHYLHLYSMIYFIKLCPHERRNVFYFISKVNATEVFTSLVFLPCLLLLWCSLHRYQVLRHAWMKKIGTLMILMNLGALTWALINCVSNLVAFIKAGKMHS